MGTVKTIMRTRVNNRQLVQDDSDVVDSDVVDDDDNDDDGDDDGDHDFDDDDHDNDDVDSLVTFKGMMIFNSWESLFSFVGDNHEERTLMKTNMSLTV